MTKIEWAVWYIMMSLADTVLTVVGLDRGLPEVNPFAAYAYGSFGLLGLLTFKVTLVTLLMVLILPNWEKRAVRFLVFAGSVAVTYAVINNIVAVWSAGG